MAVAGEQSRRDRILAAAASEFASHGFAGARVERVAATASVNKQLLFHYFRSKAGLHDAVISAVVDHFPVDVTIGGLPAKRLLHVVTQLGSAAMAHPPLVSLLTAPDISTDTSAEAGRLANEWRSSAVRSAVQVLEDGQRTGHIRDDADLEMAAEVIVAASLGWPAVGGRDGRGSTANREDQFRETLVRMALDYCAWR